MKARIKGTYEWLDFEATVLQNTELITEGYLCVKTGEVYKKEDLVFFDEYKDTLNVEPPKSINWQDVRVRAAIAALNGLLSDVNHHGNSIDFVRQAINCANELVKQLKGE